MSKANHKGQKGILYVGMGVLIVALLASISVNICLAFFKDDSSSQGPSDSSSQSASDSSSQSSSSSASQSSSSVSQSTGSYLQSTDQIYIMEAGILRNHLAFRDGEAHDFTYDFTNDEYAELKSKYDIESIAGDGTEFERVCRLSGEFAPRLTHKSNYDNHVEKNAIALLEYSLDNPGQGINCTAKAQILNEMCLALNIYARKVWIMPNSVYDGECHVVNEVWDSTLNKWVMIDITSNTYWVDEKGTPLSILEIRQKGAMQEFCIPIRIGKPLSNSEEMVQKLYIMKNMAYMEYCSDYTVGENEKFILAPTNLEREAFHSEENKARLISQASVEKSPVQ